MLVCVSVTSVVNATSIRLIVTISGLLKTHAFINFIFRKQCDNKAIENRISSYFLCYTNGINQHYQNLLCIIKRGFTFSI